MSKHPIYEELQVLEETCQLSALITRSEQILASYPAESGDVTHGYALAGLAFGTHAQFEFARAMALIEDAISFARQHEFDHLLATALIYKSTFLSYYIGTEGARYNVHSEVLQIGEWLEDQDPYGYALASQAGHFGKIGNLLEMNRLMTQAKTVAEKHNLDDLWVNIRLWQAQYADISYTQKLELTQQALDSATQRNNLTLRLYVLLIRATVMMHYNLKFSGAEIISAIEQCAQEAEKAGHRVRQTEALYLLGNFYANARDFAQSIPPLEQALANSPEDIDIVIYSAIFVQLMFAYFSNNEFDKMLDHEEQLDYLAMFVRDDINNVNIYASLALAHSAKGRCSRVNHYFRKAYEYADSSNRSSLRIMHGIGLLRCNTARLFRRG